MMSDEKDEGRSTELDDIYSIFLSSKHRTSTCISEIYVTLMSDAIFSCVCSVQAIKISLCIAIEIYYGHTIISTCHFEMNTYYVYNPFTTKHR